MVRCRDAKANSFVAKFRGKVLAHFHAVAVKRHSSMLNWLFGLSGRIILKNSLDVKENYDHPLDFALHLSRLFQSRWVWIFRVRLMLSSSNACLIIARVSVSLVPRFSQKWWCPLSDPSRNHIRPDTWLQIKEGKKPGRPPSYVKFWKLVPKIR
jgi:hypothetical protein